MARYTGPTCRLMRREGVDLSLKSGVRSFDSKCKSKTPPGMHGVRRMRTSDYRTQLREKQKVRRLYGVLEKQFRNYYFKASRQHGETGYNLLLMLERRLDNVVYRMGFGATRAEARQLVTHRSIRVTGKSVNIPSWLVSPEDTVAVTEKARKQMRVDTALTLSAQRPAIDWVSVDPAKGEGRYTRHPNRDEILQDINENLIVELYSR